MIRWLCFILVSKNWGIAKLNLVISKLLIAILICGKVYLVLHSIKYSNVIFSLFVSSSIVLALPNFDKNACSTNNLLIHAILNFCLGYYVLVFLLDIIRFDHFYINSNILFFIVLIFMHYIFISVQTVSEYFFEA